MGCCEKIREAAATMTPCECAAAGYCPLHKFTTTQREHELCRTRHDYYQSFASPDCPLHARERMMNGEKPRLPWYPRFGNWAAASIRFATFGRVTPCTGCKGRVASMNLFGLKLAEWCRRRVVA